MTGPRISFEARLILEISKIDQHISDLLMEKAALTRQLLKARARDPRLRDVTRLNSGQRVLVEDAILGFLQKTRAPCSPSDILAHVRQEAVHDLNENTLRTYLHRMKDRGLVTNPSRGAWRSSSPPQP
jgi:hypothetical protein